MATLLVYLYADKFNWTEVRWAAGVMIGIVSLYLCFRAIKSVLSSRN